MLNIVYNLYSRLNKMSKELDMLRRLMLIYKDLLGIINNNSFDMNNTPQHKLNTKYCYKINNLNCNSHMHQLKYLDKFHLDKYFGNFH